MFNNVAKIGDLKSRFAWQDTKKNPLTFVC